MCLNPNLGDTIVGYLHIVTTGLEQFHGIIWINLFSGYPQ